jgi:hypothetical protein
MDRKLRVGVLLDRLLLSAWAYRMFERIQQSDHAEIALIVLNGTPEEPQPGTLERLQSKWRGLPAVVVGRCLDGLLISPAAAMRPMHSRATT